MPALNPLRHLPAAERRRLVDLRHQAECAEHHARTLTGAAKADAQAYARKCRALYQQGLPGNALYAWR